MADEIAVGGGTLIDGEVLITVSYLPAGSNAISAAYQGSSGFAASKSAPLTQVVHAATTTTNVTSSANTGATNQSITYTATVASQHGGAATGSVLFMSGAQILGTAPLNSNRATLTTSFATPGNYSISTRYAGDANNVGSMSAVLSQKVIASTKTMLSSSLNPALPGQAIKFTAFVSATSGLPPDGETVTFNNGTSILGTAVLSGGSVSFTTSSLPAGAYTITASYGGDSNFAASTSTGRRQVVNATNRSAALTTMVSSLNPSTYGQAVTFMAMVTSSGQNTPTGNVVFRASQNGANLTLGTAPLNANRVASLTKSNLNGSYSYSITAVYSGDMFNLGSTSAVVPQVVKQARSVATVTSSTNPSSLGQAVTFTATITSPTVTVTGPVTFTAGNTVLGTAQLSRGKATFTTSALPSGSTTVKVTYPWNSNVGKSSASLVQTVQ